MSVAHATILQPTKERNTMHKITLAYDSNAPHWSKEYADELEAWQEFFKFTDWGFADEYATVNMSLPSGKMYTRTFYRRDRAVITK
jgi:hypothetical protein